MHAVLHWQNKTVPARLYHITGDNDHVFDYRNIKEPILIKGGSHVMIFDRAEEISRVLNDILSQ